MILKFLNNAFEHGDISPCFETAEFSCTVGLTTIDVYCKGKAPLLLNLQFLLLHSEKRLSSESGLAIYHLRASCL